MKRHRLQTLAQELIVDWVGHRQDGPHGPLKVVWARKDVQLCPHTVYTLTSRSKGNTRGKAIVRAALGEKEPRKVIGFQRRLVGRVIGRPVHDDAHHRHVPDGVKHSVGLGGKRIPLGRS